MSFSATLYHQAYNLTLFSLGLKSLARGNTPAYYKPIKATKSCIDLALVVVALFEKRGRQHSELCKVVGSLVKKLCKLT